MNNNLLDDLWESVENGNSIINESTFSTFVYRLIHQYSLQINVIPSGQLYTRFNTLLNTLRQSPTRANLNNLFNWIYHTFHNLNEYDAFEDYLMNPDDEEAIGVNIPVNPDGESDAELNSLWGDDEEDEQNGNGRNPYALLEQKGHEGKFTAQFKARKPHLRHLKSLEEFAHYILAHPTEFNKISKQRANYYRNLIQQHGNPRTYKGGMKQNAKSQVLTDEEILRNLENRLMSNNDFDIPPSLPNYPAEFAIFPEDIPPPPNYIPALPPPPPIPPFLPEFIAGYEYNPEDYFPLPPPPHISTTLSHKGSGRLTKKMMKDLRAYHRQVGGKISTKDFNLMLKETYKKPQDRDKHIGDYYIDESLSTPENVVYHNPKTGETKVAYRGTEGTLKDWGNTALYAFGLHNTSKRYKRSNEIQKQVEQKYGTENLDVLGHSQSGAYAQEIGKNAKNVIVLNPATHPGYTPKTKNTTVVRSTGDAVSGLKYLNPLNWGKKKTADVEIKAETYNPVTEHMPNVLERLPEDTILGNGRKRRVNKKLNRLCNCCGAKCPYCC
jgi:hypothetical protein